MVLPVVQVKSFHEQIKKFIAQELGLDEYDKKTKQRLVDQLCIRASVNVGLGRRRLSPLSPRLPCPNMEG